MLASTVRRGTVIGGVRVERTSTYTQSGRRMVRLHLDDGTTRECVPGADLDVTHTRRVHLDAAVVRAPKRSEILPAIEDAQMPGRDGRRGIATTRRPS